MISLHIGDKILEVNGTPVKDHSIDNIDKLIQSSDKVLQLTIEHDPDRLTKSCSDAASANPFETDLSPIVNNHNKSAIDLYKRAPPNTVKIKSGDSTPATVDNAHKYTPAERLFIKNIVEADISGTKTKQMRKGKNLNLNCAMSSNSLKEQKERCSSMSKLLDENHVPNTEFYDLSRTKSFRVDGQEVTPRIFRASDLVQGK